MRTLLDRGATVRALIAPPGQDAREPPAGVLGVRAEIEDAGVLRTLADGVDVVVHLAGPAAVAPSFEAPREYARAHVMGTISVLETCRRARVARLVYVSSAEVYGRSAEERVPESGPLQPRSPYGAAKAAAEQFVRAFADAFALQAVILRPFSVYGPGQRPQSLVGAVIDQALRAEAVVVADLRPTRDYCFVDDVAGGIVRACAADLRSPCALNLGTGRGTSVAELARLVLAILRVERAVREHGPGDRPRDADILHLVADPTLARATLGWEARTPLAAGLERTIRWARAR